MEFVEKMRWWHWVAVSLLLGALLGYLNSGGADASVQHASMSAMVFEQNLLHDPYVDPANPAKKQSWISNIVVHPVQDVKVGNKITQVQVVTFDCMFNPDANHPHAWRAAASFLAAFPYEPTPRNQPSNRQPEYPGVTEYDPGPDDTLNSVATQYYHKATPQDLKAIIDANNDLRKAKNASELQFDLNRRYWIPWDPATGHTVSDFLVAASKVRLDEQGAGAIPITFRYTWWESPKYVYQIWMIGSFVIVGVIWPSLLFFMVTGGLGQTDPEEFKLSRYKPAKVSSTAPAGATVTQSDMDRLRELEQNLEASLKGSGISVTTPAQPQSEPTPAQIKVLTGGAESSPAPAPTPEEQKSYTGEFYPVAHPNDKKDKSR